MVHFKMTPNVLWLTYLVRGLKNVNTSNDSRCCRFEPVTLATLSAHSVFSAARAVNVFSLPKKTLKPRLVAMAG